MFWNIALFIVGKTIAVSSPPGYGRIGSMISNIITHVDERPEAQVLTDTWQGTALHLALVLLLVMVSGLYAGLTIGLMALDETTLEVIKNSGTPDQRKYAQRIAPLRKDGYMLLVTLLLASTIINETIPIVADRFLGTGFAAIIVSTMLVLLIGEIIPQALCTKYALTIGGKCFWIVKLSLFCLFPIAYPAARLLERMLGGKPENPVVYRRAELKELVTIMGGKIELAPEEVKIIRGVLDLRDKHPALIMTPLDKVFMLDVDSSIDDTIMEAIIGKGYSRLPVYSGNDRQNIIGMLLVKRLIAIDLDHPIPVSSLSLSPLLAVGSTQSLFTILHEFQQGKSHMAIVLGGEENKPVGIITLEDIIEELLQEEIVDETDSLEHLRLGPTTTMLDLLQEQQRTGASGLLRISSHRRART